VSIANDSLESFLLEQQRATTREGPRTQPDTVWIKPPPKILKLNWDAAVDNKAKMMGVGMVVRDSHREVWATKCMRVPLIVDQPTAKVVAAWHVAKFCCEHGYPRAIFEGDSLKVVSLTL